MRLKFIYLLVGICVLPLLTSPVQAEDISDRIQTRYKEISSFRASFVQELTRAASGKTVQRKGMIYFQKPANVRWQTNEPEKELLVVNNSTVWQYIPKENLAYKFALRNKFKSKTMIEFITGEVNVEKDFQLKRLGESKQGWVKLELTPREPEPSMVMAHLWVEPETGLLRRIKIKDFWSNENTLTFEDIQLSPDISPDLFSFEPPEDVQVKDNT